MFFLVYGVNVRRESHGSTCSFEYHSSLQVEVELFRGVDSSGDGEKEIDLRPIMMWNRRYEQMD